MQQCMPDVAQRCRYMFMIKVTLRVKRLMKRTHEFVHDSAFGGTREPHIRPIVERGRNPAMICYAATYA